MKRSVSWILLILIFSLCAVGAMGVNTVAYAANENDPASFLENNNGAVADGIQDANNDLETGGRSVYAIIKTISNVAGFLVLALYGLQWMTAGKNSNKRVELKDQMQWYVGGAILAFSTRGIYTIIYNLGKMFGN